MMTEIQWDRLLKIRTTGRDDSRADSYRYPYEPTPYCVLERLANSGYVTKKNVLVDYGCGKGRVGFFMSYQTRCRAIGIEYDERIYASACENSRTSLSGSRTELVPGSAEEYEVPVEADRMFFFNPFSVEILRSVVMEIIGSWWESPREVYLFFYYPSDAYVSFLMTVGELEFLDDIDCMDLFPGEDSREKILIFRVSLGDER